jgi:hypothetical protein
MLMAFPTSDMSGHKILINESRSSESRHGGGEHRLQAIGILGHAQVDGREDGMTHISTTTAAVGTQ